MGIGCRGGSQLQNRGSRAGVGVGMVRGKGFVGFSVSWLLVSFILVNWFLVLLFLAFCFS